MRLAGIPGGPPTLLQEGHLKPVAQGRVQAAFEYLQGGRLHSLPGQPVLVHSHPHSKEVFPYTQTAPSAFRCVPVASGPVSGHHREEPGSGLFVPTLQVFIYIDEIPPEPFFLLAEQS